VLAGAGTLSPQQSVNSGGVPSEALTSPALLSQRERREKDSLKQRFF
jgi:hypothetical protein